MVYLCLQELQEEVEYQHKEKKKAIAKLHRVCGFLTNRSSRIYAEVFGLLDGITMRELLVLQLREELEGRGVANGERIFLHQRGDSNMGVGSRSLTRCLPHGCHCSDLSAMSCLGVVPAVLSCVVFRCF